MLTRYLTRPDYVGVIRGQIGPKVKSDLRFLTKVIWGRNEQYQEKYVWNPDGSGECKFKCQYDIPSEGPIWVDDSSKCPKCRPNWAFDFMTGHCRQCPCQYRSRALFQWDLCSSCPVKGVTRRIFYQTGSKIK